MKHPYLNIVLLLLVFTNSAFALQDLSAEIVDIRTGFHQSFSRVVIEVFTRPRYDLVKDFEHNAIIIGVDAGINPSQLGQIKIHKRDRFLKSIEYDQSGERLQIIVYLTSMDLDIKSYELDWPYRIAIDISPAFFSSQNRPGETFVSTQAKSTRTAVKKPATEVTPKKMFAQETGAADSLLVALAAPDSNAVASIQPDTTVKINAFMLLDESIFPDIKRHFIPKESPKPPSQFQLPEKMKRIFLISAGFISLNIILAAVFLAKRRRKQRGPRQKRRPNPVSSNQVILPQFKNMLQAALQADIKPTAEKNAVNKVASNLKTTPHEVILNDIADITASLKDNNVVGSLSDAISKKVTTAQRHATDDIEVIAAASRLTKEELMGKDGLDFVKNLKLLSLN